MLLLAACGSNSLTVLPNAISWGEVDFQEDLPSDGYLAKELILRNDGKKPLEGVRIEGLDETRLILTAFYVDGVLPAIDPEASNVIKVGVGGYELGERDTEVSGSFRVTGDGLNDPVVVTWSFTPVRYIGGDTGR